LATCLVAASVCSPKVVELNLRAPQAGAQLVSARTAALEGSKCVALAAGGARFCFRLHPVGVETAEALAVLLDFARPSAGEIGELAGYACPLGA
jgi:hypothetical protein